MSNHSNDTDEDPASSEGRRPTSSNRANSWSQHRSEDEDQDNAHTPPSPSAFIWGGSRRTISSPASYPLGPNSDRRGNISLTLAPNRRTGGNSSSATGAYSSSSTQAHSPRMSQYNARPANYQHGPYNEYRGDIFLTSAQDRRTGGNLSSAMGACSLSSTQAHSPRMSQHNTRTPTLPSPFFWGGSRHTVSLPASYPPRPNSDYRGDISLTAAQDRRTGSNLSSAMGAYSLSSTLAQSPQMSQHNTRQNALSPLARDTRMDHPASSFTGPSSLPAENGRASRPYPPEGRQSKRQRRELDDNVGSVELNTETNESSPDRQQRAKVTTPNVGSSIAFRPINKASNSQPVPAPSESYVQAANNRVSKGVRPNKQSSSRGVPGRETRANKYADSGRCTRCGKLLPSNNSSSRRCDECRQKVRKRKQAKRDKGVCVECTRPAAPGYTMCQNHLKYYRKHQRNQYKRSKEEEKAKEDAAGTEVAEADASNSESEGAQDEADGMEFSGPGESTDGGEDDSDMDGAAQEQLVSV